MISLALAVLLSASQADPALSKKVTLEEPASLAGKCIADLAKISGVPMFADDDVNREVLLVSVKDVPLGELMKRVAKVSSARWVVGAHSYNLVPDTEMREHQEQKRLADRAANLSQWFQRQQSPKKDESPSSTREEMVASSIGMASEGDTHFVVQSLKGVDMRHLASIDGDHRLVLSSKPTAMQSPFPSFDQAALNALIEAHNQSVKEMGEPARQAPGRGRTAGGLLRDDGVLGCALDDIAHRDSSREDVAGD
jgi:hypothetical protein